MALQRKKQWDSLELDGYLRMRAAQPFAWGVNDCALFAANAIETMTGTDIAADFRGADARPAYTDEAGAFALITKVTGSTSPPATAIGDAAAWCAAKHGMAEWLASGRPAPLLARRGDLVVVSNGGRLIAGVVHLNGLHVVTMAETGIVRLPLRAVTRAWKV